MSSLRRSAAAASDFLLAAALSVVTAPQLGVWCGERAVLALSIGEPSSWWRGPLPLVLGLAGNVVFAMPFTLIAVGLARLAFGRTPGQALWRAEVTSLSQSFASRSLRWAYDYAPALLLALALTVGHLAFTEVTVGLLGLWLVARVLRTHRV